MKILVIGATGLTGGCLLKHLLKDGHEVTAFVRNPSKLTIQDSHLKVAQGEARDITSLEHAILGQDAVMSAFGPSSLKKNNIQEVFMKNLVAAMTKCNVKRLINLSAMGAGDSRKGSPLFLQVVIIPLLLGRMFADKEKGEVYLMESSLEYINVRPGRLINTPARGGVKASLQYKGLKPLMSREDLALFMIKQLNDSTWVRKSPLIGY